MTKDRSKRLTPQEKLQLVLGSYQAENVAEYCREKGIDRSYLYQLRRELEDGATSSWEAKKPGRPANPQQETEPQVQELEARLKDLEQERLSLLCQNECANILLDVYDEAGLFGDKRIKKKLSKPLRAWISERRSKRRRKD